MATLYEESQTVTVLPLEQRRCHAPVLGGNPPRSVCSSLSSPLTHPESARVRNTKHHLIKSEERTPGYGEHKSWNFVSKRKPF